MKKWVKFIYTENNTFPRDADPRPILIDGYIYEVVGEDHSTYALAGIRISFPKYAFIEIK